jgi:hypothetical protein
VPHKIKKNEAFINFSKSYSAKSLEKLWCCSNLSSSWWILSLLYNLYLISSQKYIFQTQICFSAFNQYLFEVKSVVVLSNSYLI